MTTAAPKTAAPKVVTAELPPQEVPFYIPALGQPSRARRTLKHGDTFAVLDSHGDIGLFTGSVDGLFNRDTRYISRFELLVNGVSPLLLGSHIREDNSVLTVELTNPDFYEAGALVLHKDNLLIRRNFFLWGDAAYSRIGVQNLAQNKVECDLTLIFANDFADIFELRGITRVRRGTSTIRRSPKSSSMDIVYQGLDHEQRTSSFQFDPPPRLLEDHRAHYKLSLQAGERCSLFVSIGCNRTDIGQRRAFFSSLAKAHRGIRASKIHDVTIQTSNDAFNQIFSRSAADLDMLMTSVDGGLYPYAGIPWYSTTFGRDGIITAMQMLWCAPDVARGTLTRLSALQATTYDPDRDAEPGKIVHEMRDGEMAHLREVPFGRYYGSVDSTPLFLMLAGAYAAQTEDYALIQQIWPNIEAALAWIDMSGDADKDGFVEYARANSDGLVNQGWKDSRDSVFHSSGELARGPIALAEVQAYVYDAKRSIAVCARRLGHDALAARLDSEAKDLAERFDDAFWCPDLGTYAIALDGAKRPCRVRTSNAGHVLLGGLAKPERAAQVVRGMMRQSFMSGWGIRTVAEDEINYNPISYHNGSIWPHDNAMIAMGFARYGYKSEAAAIFQAIAGAASYMEFRRLPELYCGFRRKFRQAPTLYPAACSPQAWASAAPFAMLQACLGLQMNAAAKTVEIKNPALPMSLDSVVISNLAIAGERVDVSVCRKGSDYSVDVIKAATIPS